MPFINARELRKMWDDRGYGPDRVQRELRESLRDGRAGKPGCLKFEDFSIRDMFEELIPGGRDIIRAWQRGSDALLEAANASDTSAFSMLVGQLAFDRLLAGYESPALIWSQLVSTMPTTKLYGEKIPGVANLGDVGQEVQEGKPYPSVTSSANYVETGRLVKRGFTVPITRELTIADNTGLVIKTLDKSGLALGINLEKRVVDLAIGVTNNYNRNGTATNTYLTAGAYINAKASNDLVDWRDIEEAELLFEQLNDPDTGEPIVIGGRTLLVPKILEMTAKRIVTATTVEHVDNQAATPTYRTMGSNPIPSGINVLSSPYVGRRSNDLNRWWYGDFKQAFGRLTAWEIERDSRGRESPLNFSNDIVMEFKGSVMDHVQVLEPRAVTQHS